MIHRQLPNEMTLLRKRSALTQSEMALVLGISHTQIREIEHGRRLPPPKALIGIEIVFDLPLEKVFPSVFEMVETHMLRRANSLFEALQTTKDARSKEKQRFLRAMIHEQEPPAFAV